MTSYGLDLHRLHSGLTQILRRCTRTPFIVKKTNSIKKRQVRLTQITLGSYTCVTQYNKRYILSTFEEKNEIFASSYRRCNKLSNDTKFIKIEVKNSEIQHLYFAHYFVHYLRMFLLLYWVTYYTPEMVLYPIQLTLCSDVTRKRSEHT